MAILTAFQFESVADAEAAAAEASAGELWGVSLGATTKAVQVGSVLVVQATATRAKNLGVKSRYYRTMSMPDIEDLDLTHATFYALGQMDA